MALRRNRIVLHCLAHQVILNKPPRQQRRMRHRRETSTKRKCTGKHHTVPVTMPLRQQIIQLALNLRQAHEKLKPRIQPINNHQRTILLPLTARHRVAATQLLQTVLQMRQFMRANQGIKHLTSLRVSARQTPVQPRIGSQHNDALPALSSLSQHRVQKV